RQRRAAPGDQGRRLRRRRDPEQDGQDGRRQTGAEEGRGRRHAQEGGRTQAMRSTITLPLLRALALAACTVVPSLAAAQTAPAPPRAPAGGSEGGDSPGAAPGAPGVTVIQVPPPAGPSYPGALPPQGWDPNGHLPSSSRASTDTSRSSDGFDFGSKGG